MRLRYLREDEIEAAALETLDAYGRRFEKVAAPPVPVEEILECDLRLEFGFEDLMDAFGADALGAMWVRERRVRVDTSLDPSVFPEKEGRYRFTVAHEIGHWQLHRHLFLADANQGSLFSAQAEPSVVCRTGSTKPPIEWQADAFSSRLLMPKEMVVRAWTELDRGEDPRFVREEGEATPLPRRSRAFDDPRALVVRMAKRFAVSAQAMRIRLTGLGLIKAHGSGYSLFG